ncbi:uncharacterized protein LOC124545328 isoform X2 [Schistocerca americana]|uniref:uncharacterized protein LOC124545328 isoform X2 n=1 Tax=Schistocerca americana TaxID=7009 RepID=UPI001F4FE6E7|nr:uncharacterized protein LOC124545328 isoform X2 [Schistocerca americana]
MDDEQNWFDKFTVIVEQNIRGVQIGIYSVGVIGLVVALKSVRPKGDVAVDLVSVGFATVSALDFTLEKDPLYITYYKRLLKTEKQAERKGHGMWATNSTWFQRIWRKVSARVQPRLLLPVALRRS